MSASHTATLACPFYGTAPIVKDGPGTLVLTGALGGHGSMKCFRPDAIWVEERGASRLMPDT